MNAGSRACVAFAAGLLLRASSDRAAATPEANAARRAAHPSLYPALYDYAQERILRLNRYVPGRGGSGGSGAGGEATATYIEIHDQERGCRFRGGGSNADYEFLDEGTGARVTLSLSPPSFSGCDHGTDARFMGGIVGGLVTIYDYEDGRYYQYALR